MKELTDEDLNRAMNNFTGVSKLFCLKKRGFYYRPNAKGYTALAGEAWLVSEEVADRHVYPHDEPVTKHPAPLKSYITDLNAMHDAEKGLTDEQHNDFRHELMLIIFAMKDQVRENRNFVSATARQRAIALLRAL